MTEESLFLAALEKQTTEERFAFLDKVCGADIGLRGRVQILLDADARVRGILDKQVASEWTGAYLPKKQSDPNFTTERPGLVIVGRYKLLEQIGEGGMGTVWVAEQSDPVRRKVALKLIKAGMDSRSVLARFDAERQALAMMDHPNIAKVLDGGLTESSRPFFVMEYVKGVPITEYCETTRLTVVDRLKLFIQVCQAVQHAHQKGIIHRDLKPSNILVAPYDDKAVPKVIDFGLAKAMHQSLTELTIHTAHGVVLGTPLYMSPEQAQLNNLDVDTRSDIYSLGVLLYELLTGTTPLEKQRFQSAAWDEIRRIIREEEPPRPSTRISSTTTLPLLAAGRQTEPTHLMKLMRGELDWIVMKSLEKDRTRRYETANGLAKDIQRFLDGDEVEACPPTFGYRLWKTYSKNRVAFRMAGAFAAVLFLSVIVSGIFGFKANEAKNVAIKEATAAKIARSQAEAAERRIEEESLIARQLNSFIFGLFESMDPKNRPGPFSLRAVLDEAGERGIDPNWHPLTRGSIHHLLAFGYLVCPDSGKALGHWKNAYKLRLDNLGKNHNQTLETMDHLAQILDIVGNHDQAQQLLEEMVEIYRQKFGSENNATIVQILKLANSYKNVRKFPQAEALYGEAAKLYSKGNGLLGPFGVESALVKLADCYAEQGRNELAVQVLIKALNELERWENFGNVDRDYHAIPVQIRLATAYIQQNDFASGEPILRRLVALPIGKFPHPFLRFQAMSLLGGVCLNEKKNTEAEGLLLPGYEGLRKHPSSPESDYKPIQLTLGWLAQLFEAKGKKEEAGKWREELEAIEAAKKNLQNKP